MRAEADLQAARYFEVKRAADAGAKLTKTRNGRARDVEAEVLAEFGSVGKRALGKYHMFGE